MDLSNTSHSPAAISRSTKWRRRKRSVSTGASRSAGRDRSARVMRDAPHRHGGVQTTADPRWQTSLDHPRGPDVAFAYPGCGRRPIPLLVIDDAGYRAVAGVAGDIVVLVRVEKGVAGEQPRAVSDHAREPEPDPRAETQGAEAGAIVVGDRREDHRHVDGP